MSKCVYTIIDIKLGTGERTLMLTIMFVPENASYNYK